MFRREYAARKIQARFRAFIQRKKYLSMNLIFKILFRDKKSLHEMSSECIDSPSQESLP